jgi:hypothetical protein
MYLRPNCPHSFQRPSSHDAVNSYAPVARVFHHIESTFFNLGHGFCNGCWNILRLWPQKCRYQNLRKFRWSSINDGVVCTDGDIDKAQVKQPWMEEARPGPKIFTGFHSLQSMKC